MPELPEVETVVRTLEHQIRGCVIEDIEVLYPKVISQMPSDQFRMRLARQRFTEFSRKGKYLIFTLTDDVLCCHLRMEGKFYLYPKGQAFDRRHVHVIFHLSDQRVLCYHDTRKFGRFYLYHQGEPLTCLADLGYEPWDENLDPKWLYAQAKAHKQMTLKDFLLDQRFIAGIGNIYANEICFVMKRHPQIKVSSLPKKAFGEMIEAVRAVLGQAIEAGGTTIRSYTSSLGVTGRFQLSLYVYQREGEPCLVCNTPIRRCTLHGRGTFFCPHCQKRGRSK